MAYKGTVKVVLFTSKSYKDGQHPVMLRVTIDRKSKYITIGTIRSNKTQWNAAAQRLKKNHINWRKGNQLISFKYGLAEQALHNLEMKGTSFTVLDFINEFQKPDDTRINLFQYFDSIINRNESGDSIRNAASYRTVKNSLLEYFQKTDIYMQDITYADIKNYISWLKGTKQVSGNTIANYLRYIKALFNTASKEKDISTKALESIKPSDYKSKPTKVTLIQKDILKIVDYNINDLHPGFDAKNIFVFMYLTYGTNFTDIAKLTAKNLIKTEQGYKISYNRSKTAKLIEVPLSDEAFRILNYYRSYRIKKKYIFPILDEDIHQTAKQKTTRIQTALKKFNKQMKALAKELNIMQNLSSYTARYSFATIMIQGGASLFELNQMFRHSTVNQTIQYVQSASTDELRKANDILLKR